MSSTGSQQRLIRFRKDIREVRLVNWPLRRDGVWPWLLLLGCGAIGAAVGAVSGQAWAGLVASAAVLLAIWRVWLPVGFELGPRGVVQTVLGRTYRISWREFLRYHPYRRGVLLLVDPRPSPLDSFRGLFIRYDDQRDAVLSVVQFYLGGDSAPDSAVGKRAEPG